MCSLPSPSMSEIVLLDGDAIVRSSLARDLRPFDIRVSGFGESQDALLYLKASLTVDILIVDAKIPPMGGFAFSKMVREVLGSRPLPILITSEIPMREELFDEAKREFGFDDLLHKPYTVQNLLLKIRKITGIETTAFRFKEQPTILTRLPEPDLLFLDQLGRTIVDHRTGSLQCDRGDLAVNLFFHSGKLVTVDNGLITPDELKLELVRRNMVNRREMDRLLAAKLSDLDSEQRNLTTLLISSGLVAAQEMAELLTEYVSRKFRKVFGWRSGTFRFKAGQTPNLGDLRYSFNLPALIYEALWDFANIGRIRELFERCRLDLETEGDVLAELGGVKLSAEERRLVGRLARYPVRVGDILDETDRAALLLMLLVLIGKVRSGNLSPHDIRERLLGMVPDGYDTRAAQLALSLEESFAQTYGRAYRYMNLGLMDMAEEEFSKALEMKPEDPRVLCYLGWTRFHKGGIRKAPEALRLIRKALEIDPRMAIADVLQGKILLSQGLEEQAEALFLAAIEIDPGNEEATEALQDLMRRKREYGSQDDLPSVDGPGGPESMATSLEIPGLPMSRKKARPTMERTRSSGQSIEQRAMSSSFRPPEDTGEQGSRLGNLSNITCLVVQLYERTGSGHDVSLHNTMVQRSLKLMVLKSLIQVGGTLEEYTRDRFVCLLGYPLEQSEHRSTGIALAMELRDKILDQMVDMDIPVENVMFKAAVVSGFCYHDEEDPDAWSGLPDLLAHAQMLLDRAFSWQILVSANTAEGLDGTFTLVPLTEGGEPSAFVLKGGESTAELAVPIGRGKPRDTTQELGSPGAERGGEEPSMEMSARLAGHSLAVADMTMSAGSEADSTGELGSSSGVGRRGRRGGELAPGSELGGHFVLRRMVGQGAMARVYEAEDVSLGRKVAIKVLSEEAMASRKAKDRFREEARALARLNSRHIIQIYFLDLEHTPPYLVLEFVDGPSLREILDQRGRLRPNQAVSIALEVVRGLKLAHDRGVIHRDINPNNIMLSKDGDVKLGDFGLAKSEFQKVSLTTSGTFLGTPLYMSPEQWRDDPVDFRSDIYSLGVTLYHVLVGTPPFVGDNVAEVMLQHVKCPLPQVLRYQEDVPEELADLVERMTAKDPADRPGSYVELLEDLSTLLGERRIPTRKIII